MAYRLIVVGFVLWTFTLIAGAIWASRAWGRYYEAGTRRRSGPSSSGRSSPATSTRGRPGWRGSRSAWLAIIGFSAVLFNFTIVNLFFKGLHAYSGL